MNLLIFFNAILLTLSMIFLFVITFFTLLLINGTNLTISFTVLGGGIITSLIFTKSFYDYFKDQSVINEITDIEWRVSKDGLIIKDKSIDTSDLNHICSDDNNDDGYDSDNIKIKTQITSPNQRMQSRMVETGESWHECPIA